MKKNIFWNTFGSIFYSACQWLITVIVYHVADLGSAGFLSLAMTTSSSFSAISLFGMRSYQVSDVKNEYSQHEYVGSRILTCIVAFITCAIASIWGNNLYQILCIDAFMLIRVAEALVDVLNGEDQKLDRYDLIGKSYILRGTATVVIFTAGLMVLQNLMVTLFIIAIVNLLIAFVFDWRKTSSLEAIKPVIYNKKIRTLLMQCVPIVVFSFLFSLEGLIPKNVLQQMEGTESLGAYSTIASPTLVISVLANVVFNPFLPVFASVYQNGEYDRFLKLLHKVYLALAGLAVVTTIGALLLGRWGLALLFGSSILKYYNLFMPIVWCTILIAFIWVLSAILIGLRQMKWLLIGMAVDFGICVALVYPIIGSMSQNGVSVVQIIAYAIYVIFMAIVCELTVRRARKCHREEM